MDKNNKNEHSVVLRPYVDYRDPLPCAKYEWVSYGWYKKDGRWSLGVIPKDVERQFKTPQWLTDRLNENLFGEIR